MWPQNNDQGIGDVEAQYISIENDGDKSQNDTECGIHSRGWTDKSLRKSNKLHQYQQEIDYPQWCNVSQLLPEHHNYTFEHANKNNKNKIRDKRRRNVNRSYEDVRDNKYWFNENRENEDKICMTCNCIIRHSSVDTPSEYMPSFIISAEKDFEEDSRRSQRSRRSEHNTNNLQQNRHSQQSAAPNPDTSYNYKLDNYDESAHMCERQQQEQELLLWQDQYQNNCRKKHSIRRLSGLGDVSYVNKNQEEFYEIQFPDLGVAKEDRLCTKCKDEWQQQGQHQNNYWKKQPVGQLSGTYDVPRASKDPKRKCEPPSTNVAPAIENNLSPIWQDQWQQQDDQVEDCRRIENKLATVEHKRLHLLQRIERYQQAWLTETRCKLEDLQRQMKVRGQKEHEEEQPQHEPGLEPWLSVREQYEPPSSQPNYQNRRRHQKPSTAPSRLTCDPVQSQWHGLPPPSSLTDFGTNADGCYEEHRQNIASKSYAPPQLLGYVDQESEDAIRTASTSTNRAGSVPCVKPPKFVKFECSCTPPEQSPEQLPAEDPTKKCNFSTPERSRSGMDCNNAAADHISSPDTIEFYKYYCPTASGAPPPTPCLQLLRMKCGNCGAGRRWT